MSSGIAVAGVDEYLPQRTGFRSIAEARQVGRVARGGMNATDDEEEEPGRHLDHAEHLLFQFGQVLVSCASMKLSELLCFLCIHLCWVNS
jgi:hypothetical protein